MKKGMFHQMAALTLALVCAAGQAYAAGRGENTTVLRERGAAQANIRDRVASILGSTELPRNRIFSPGTSRLMHRWPTESYDTGGTLLFSDSPEYVKETGVLYRDIVTGDARVLYYHLNDTSQPKKVAVVLETDAELASVSVTRGAAAPPSADYLHVGKVTQIGYFDTHEMNERIYVTKERPRLLVPEMDTTVLAPGQLVYGVYDFHANAPVRVSVIMYGADVDPFAFLRTARVLPRDEIALRGTFRGMNRVITSKKIYRPSMDGAVYFPIGDNLHDVYRQGIDATDGSSVVNYGNYGILYQISIPTAGRENTRYFLSPLGGVYAGAMRAENGANRRLVETPATRPYFGDQTLPEPPNVAEAREEGLLFLTQYTELSDLGTYASAQPVQFEYSPPGASNLPVNIILMPEK
ncbi:copper amine oxidase [uncultured Selenomonas sp.]|uniref:copper amine oxidase n=1 Tax=uncultured Selenomonas sp. TaxID=159275 RepID=UPI0028E3C204|nr:copper amine oxidase [uncultured Selenomonas sp.]